MRLTTPTASRRAADETGFSLVELLVSITIVGIVGAIVMSSIVVAMNRAASATNRTNALTDIERGLERISRQIRVADPLDIDPDNACATLSVDACVAEVLTRRLDATTFANGQQLVYRYYLVETADDVELRQDVQTVDPLTGTVMSTSTGEFIAEIGNLDPAVGEPLFRFLTEDEVTGALLEVDCAGVTVDRCRELYGSASVIEITLMKQLQEGDPLSVSTLVNIRNTRYET